MIDSLKSLTSPATRLDAIILTLSIQLIAALLTSFMLIWHVSTVHLLWNHSMPEDWKEEFKRQEFGGKRGALWGVVLAFIPVDCMHTLLALDYFHGCRFERSRENGVFAGKAGAETVSTALDDTVSNPTQTFVTACTTSPIRYSTNTGSSLTFNTAHATPPLSRTLNETPPFLRDQKPTTPPLPTHPDFSTYHPLLLQCYTYRTRFWLLVFYDTFTVAVLFVHLTFQLLFPEPTSKMDCRLGLLRACRLVDADIFVPSMADFVVAMVLLWSHVWQLAFRVWEAGICGIKRGERCDNADGEGEKGETSGNTRRASGHSNKGSIGGEKECKVCIAKQRLGAGIVNRAFRLRDWVVQMRRSKEEGFYVETDGARDDAVEAVGWNEVFLEFLVE